MRIALVSEHASPLALLGSEDAGGQNVHVAELAAGLGRLGVEVVVHTRRDDPSLPRRVAFAPNVVVDHVPAGPPQPIPKDELVPYLPAFRDELVAAWTAELPDAVHSHFWMSGWVTLTAAREVGVPMLHTFHALGAEKRRHQGHCDTSPPMREEVERVIACEADLIVATTRAEARTLRAMGAAEDRVRVVPCGVDLSRFSTEVPGVLRPTGRPRIVVASRLVARKGIAEVIRALPSVPGAELVVAGGPPAGLVTDDPEGVRLAEVAREVGVDDRVEFLGAVSRDDMPALLRSADVVACCPWYEPFGLVAVEAMACGVPVVATQVGGLAETVADGVTGLLVEPRNPSAIAAALDRILSDPATRRRMAERALQRARRYGWDGVAESTLQHARAAAEAYERAAIPTDEASRT